MLNNFASLSFIFFLFFDFLSAQIELHKVNLEREDFYNKSNILSIASFKLYNNMKSNDIKYQQIPFNNFKNAIYSYNINSTKNEVLMEIDLDILLKRKYQQNLFKGENDINILFNVKNDKSISVFFDFLEENKILDSNIYISDEKIIFSFKNLNKYKVIQALLEKNLSFEERYIDNFQLI